MKKIGHLLFVLVLALLVLARSSTCLSDDIDLFFQQRAAANILFVVDTSGNPSDPIVEDKMRVIKNALTSLLSKAQGDINVGVMRFDDQNFQVGKVLNPIRTLNADASGNARDLDTRTFREVLMESVASLTASGVSPWTRALLEASLYFNGQKLIDVSAYGTLSSAYQCDATAKARAICYSVGTQSWYKKPLTSSCAHNFLVIISGSGAQYADSAEYPFSRWASSDIAQYMGLSSSATCSHSVALGTTANSHETCGTDLVAYMRNSAAQVKTHTIAYTANHQSTDFGFLQKLADSGGGEMAIANDEDSLLKALQTILLSINPSSVIQKSFSTATTFLDETMKLKNSDQVLLPLLNTQDAYSWEGNLKKYRIDHTRLVDKNDKPVYSTTKDPNGVEIHTIDETTIDFLQNTPENKGEFISSGGVESHIDVNNRKIFWDSNLHELSALKNDETFQQYFSQTGLAEKLKALGVDANGAIRWLNGFAYDTALKQVSTLKRRHVMGDVLHSSPVTIEFGGETYLIVGTNAGFVHMFKATESASDFGDELFSFIPRRFFADLDKRIANQPGWQHGYGVDGQLSAVVNKTGDLLTLYVSLRRGGSALYAIEINNDLQPRLLWMKDSSSAGYQRLGQTWSKPIPTQINGENVLAFGGGYDPKSDWSIDGKSTVGNAIYIADAQTGDIRWSTETTKPSNLNWAKHFASKMIFSIASNLALVDINGDGNIDQLYAADLGGQLWRFDIHRNWEITGGVIADLRSTTNRIKFYNTPDIAIVNNGPERYLSISLGSGWRENPFDTQIKDYFFSLKQPLAPQSEYPTDTITIDDLADAPVAGVANEVQALMAVETNKQGWKYALSNTGEKVFSDSLTLANKILFTTMTTPPINDACNTPISADVFPVYRLYAMNIKNSAAFVDFDNSGTVHGECDGERCAALNVYVSPNAYFQDDVLQALVLPHTNIDIESLETTVTHWNNHVED